MVRMTSFPVRQDHGFRAKLADYGGEPQLVGTSGLHVGVGDSEVAAPSDSKNSCGFGGFLGASFGSAPGAHLASGEVETVIWATGFRPDYSWLDITVLDSKGMIRHDGGVVVDSPGMFLLGSPFLRRRKSSFIDGARVDAQELIVELTAYLDARDSVTRD